MAPPTHGSRSIVATFMSAFGEWLASPERPTWAHCRQQVAENGLSADGRNNADLGAVQEGADAAHGDRRRTGNEELTTGAVMRFCGGRLVSCVCVKHATAEHQQRGRSPAFLLHRDARRQTRD